MQPPRPLRLIEVFQCLPDEVKTEYCEKIQNEPLLTKKKLMILGQGPRALVAIIGLKTATFVSRKEQGGEFGLQSFPLPMQHVATKMSLITEWQFWQLWQMWNDMARMTRRLQVIWGHHHWDADSISGQNLSVDEKLHSRFQVEDII